MKVLFFGRYDPDYSRNAVLMKGLRLNGVDVIECRVEPSVRFWPVRLIWRYLRVRPAFDAMLVGFPGQEVMLLARFLTRKPIIFDAFTSHYEGYVEDRKSVSPHSLKARWYWLLDWFACRMASAVLTDTRQHAKYFYERFRVPTTKIHAVLLGTLLQPVIPNLNGKPFTVHFHGSNVPLQGVDIIWRAIRRVWNEDVHFQIVGPFVVPQELRDKVEHRDYVPFADLADLIARADVCLGIFGDSAKVRRVIPNKVYEAVAAGKPVITADTPAIRELFSGEMMSLIPAGDADALARAILRIRDEPELALRHATHAQQRLTEAALPAILGKRVLEVIQDSP